jgi:thiol-disulfide isomerase/thioredoxin
MESIMNATVVPALLMSALLGGSPRGVVLDFSATWCGPCQQMNPIVSRLERQGYSIRKVDVDKEKELASRFNVSSIPCFVLVVDGKEVTRITGATSEEQLKRLLAQIPSDPPPVAATTPAASQPIRPTRQASQNDFEFEEPTRFAQADIPQEPVAGEQRPSPARLTQTQTETTADSEPARSGNLFGRLWGRKDPDAQTEPRNVRATDEELDEPINLLPVRNPLRASVRLHVTINGQTSVGSGTAIDSRPGRTVIATCGHLFKGWNEQSRIEVDVFTETGIKKFVGRMVSYDVAADVGLVTLNTDGYIATAEVPDVSGRPQTREEVVNIGCSGGAPPTQEAVQVTALNYFEGPDNIECTGVPVQGRSGGGLFNQQGQLVGVCIGADAQRQRGAYAGLLAIHDQLDAAGMTALYRRPPAAAQADAVALAAEQAPRQNQFNADALAESAFSAGPATPAGRGQQTTQGEVTQPPFEAVTESSAAALAADADAEVICIIRDRSQPGSPSRVVIIDRASPTFLNYLGGEVKPTAMDPRAAQPQPPSTRANRVPSGDSTGYSTLTDPSAVFRPEMSSRPLFTTPGEPQMQARQRSRSLSLQPTAMEEVFAAERYVRSR